MKLISLLLGVVILAFLSIYAFRTYYTSSPTGEKGETAISAAYDAQRMADLQGLETALVTYYSTNYNYPDTLEDLIPDFTNSIPKDPETLEDYGYEKTSSGYRLYCKLSSEEKMQNDEGSDPDYYELIDE
ncbi:hypothetical protein ACFL14_01265 [Patescibacteria group bacterium]